MRTTLFTLCFGVSVIIGMACGDDDEHDEDAEVQECSPEGACSCTEGTERATACVCTGGSSCEVDGDDIEFTCEGNAGCTLTCGDDCLVTCPGTTTCDIEVGDDAVINCPGNAICNITCQQDCTVYVDGAAMANVDCVNEAEGAVCEVNP